MPLLVLRLDLFFDVLQARRQGRFLISIALHFLELGTDLVHDVLMPLFRIGDVGFYGFDIVLIGCQVIIVPDFQILGLDSFGLLHQFDDFGMVFVELVFFSAA